MSKKTNEQTKITKITKPQAGQTFKKNRKTSDNNHLLDVVCVLTVFHFDRPQRSPASSSGTWLYELNCTIWEWAFSPPPRSYT